MISLTIASKYADTDCVQCEGTGLVASLDDCDESYCFCVIENRKQKEHDD